jgi:uncharacterized protein YndB with AHSA1/START domain
MATVEQVINTTPERVFAVLADGWTYSDWVVGSAHIRDVDPEFPRSGFKLYHKVGPWPLSVEDESVSLECEAPYLLLLKVKLWPLGAGKVRFVLTPVGDKDTRVTMTEEFTEGPLVAARNKINHLMLRGRNKESLRRLADLAIHRAARAPLIDWSAAPRRAPTQ